LRSGATHIDSVEFFNCSQIDTQKAAVRFKNAATLSSSVTNSALHNGYSWAVYIAGSQNIEFSNNVVFNFRPVGVNIGRSNNIKIDGNVIAHIQ